jgi:hypothetical protein
MLRIKKIPISAFGHLSDMKPQSYKYHFNNMSGAFF